MRLVNNALETETHQTQDADHDAVELIEPSILSQQSVCGLVQPDEGAVHEVAGGQDEQQRR